MKVTLREVAEAAGVSMMSVSKVLHGTGTNTRVSEARAQFIRETAERLGYTPNEIARSLRGRRTRTIGVTFDGWGRLGSDRQFHALMLDGIFDAAFALDYAVTICPRLIARDGNGIRADGRFDGLLYGSVPHNPDAFSAIKASRLPIVLMFTPPTADLEGINSVCCDNQQGIALAIQHLVQLGHRKISLVFDKEIIRSLEYAERLRAFEQAIERFHISSESLSWSESGNEFGDWWTSEGRGTAIITASDNLAEGILRQTDRLGVAVPHQLSLITYDSTHFCDLTRPRLSSISQPVQLIAHKACELLIDMIEGRTSTTRHYLYPCGLDLRESTARPLDEEAPTDEKGFYAY